MNLADGKVLYEDLRQRIEQSCGSFIPTFTKDAQGVWSCDKTYAEVQAAILAGKCLGCRCVWSVDGLRQEERMIADRYDEDYGICAFKVLYSTSPVSYRELRFDSGGYIAEFTGDLSEIDDTAGAGDTDVTFSADKLATMDSELKSAINGKQTKPATAGTAGQVLSLDSNLDPVWTTPQGGGGAVDDVRINGTSIVTDGIATIPDASLNRRGVVSAGNNTSTDTGIFRSGTYNALFIAPASSNDIKTPAGLNIRRPIIPNKQHEATFYGLAKAAGDATQSASSNAVGTYTEDAKSAISEMLNGAVSVSGTTPSITALPGVRYICGQVDTLTIVVPSSGCIDVTFESGSTPTVLTVTPPSGMTMRWANGFDPTALEANTTYEINIMDGCLGVAGSWT